MFRALRVLIIAAVIAVSLAVGSSSASADSSGRFAHHRTPAAVSGITWE